jgi:hypothetical protein
LTVPTPKNLQPAGRKLWRETTAQYELRQDELEILRAACGEIDLINRIEEELKDAPLTVRGSQGQIVAHPLIQEVRQHRATVTHLFAKLKLPDEQGASGNQHRDAARARWAVSYGK